MGKIITNDGAEGVGMDGYLNVNDPIQIGGTQVLAAQQAAVADTATTNDPGDGTVGALTISGTFSQAEVQALRNEVEKLRDYVADLHATQSSLLAKLRTHGIIAT